jgi:uncharacterized membrane protein
MSLLVAGLVLFLGVHLVPTVPPLRAELAGRLGDRGYRGAFSLVALAGLVLIVVGFGRAAREPQLFTPSATAIAIAPIAMVVAFVLLAAANMRSHLRRRLQHPMLLGVLIWASVHLLANGDLRGTVLFGAFVAYTIVDLASAAHRRAVKAFEPAARFDVIAVVAGVAVSVAVMALHRPLFGVPVVSFGL